LRAAELGHAVSPLASVRTPKSPSVQRCKPNALVRSFGDDSFANLFNERGNFLATMQGISLAAPDLNA